MSGKTENIRQGISTKKHVEQLIFISIGEYFREWINKEEGMTQDEIVETKGLSHQTVRLNQKLQ